jgi:uncharacterized protein
MLQISELYIYPVKSLGSIAKQSVQLVNTGFKYDRRWMLVDENNIFLSQRTLPRMALLQVTETDAGFKINPHYDVNTAIIIPFQTKAVKKIKVTVWDDVCDAVAISELHDEWFSNMLKTKCKLVYMTDDTARPVDKVYASNNEITSFSDGYPVLMIGTAALIQLNNKLTEALPMNRFRPNIVFTGGHAHLEDELEQFSINTIDFLGVKPCSRCVMTTINQQNGSKGQEPLKTLSAYRMKNNKIYFGQNVLHQQNGNISIGDAITIKRQSLPLF